MRALAQGDVLFIVVGGVAGAAHGIEKLILVKRAAGRPRDFRAIAELEALREERDAGQSRG